MAHSHRIRDIAEQSGLSAATVDRVLHSRPSASARATRQVEQAILDLDRQQTQLRLAAATLMVDVVLQAPRRFTDAVRSAVEAELVQVRPVTARARFHIREVGGADDLAELLDTISRRGRSSQAVLLKAPDHPDVAEAITRLTRRRIPVVTLVTDVRHSPRVAYVGLDNASAGATAAYLVATTLRGRVDRVGQPVLVTSTQASFFGERERWMSFSAEMARLEPDRRVVLVPDADGLDERVRSAVTPVIADEPAVAAVYSIGGGNQALTDLLVETGRVPQVYVAHDLDADNRRLLAQGRVSLVLHHDLRRDVRSALVQALRHHGLMRGAPRTVFSPVEVITPHNLPTSSR